MLSIDEITSSPRSAGQIKKLAKNPEWVIEGRLGSCGLLNLWGAPKNSTLHIELLLAISTGTRFLGCSTKQCKVLLIDRYWFLSDLTHTMEEYSDIFGFDSQTVEKFSSIVSLRDIGFTTINELADSLDEYGGDLIIVNGLDALESNGDSWRILDSLSRKKPIVTFSDDPQQGFKNWEVSEC